MLLTPIEREVARCVASLFITQFIMYIMKGEDNENESYFFRY